MKKSSIIIMVLLVIIIIGLACRDNPVVPKDDPPGRRDYIWKMDTLDMPMNSLNELWGSSADDVWAVGDMGQCTDRLWHYDGTKWKAYDKEVITGTGRTLFGFNKNDIWMGCGPDASGPGGTLWHYNGTQWREKMRYSVGAYITSFTDIWGLSSTDIYACGIHLYRDTKVFQGFILHNDGNGWQEVVRSDFNKQFRGIKNGRNGIFIDVEKRGDVDSVSFYKLSGKQLVEIFTESYEKAREIHLEVLNNEVYFMIKNGIYRYFNSRFIRVISIDFQNFGYRFNGRNRNDIIFRMTDGLAHYNGTDIQYIYRSNSRDENFRAYAALFEKDAFLGVWGNSLGKNYILHGRLD